MGASSCDTLLGHCLLAGARLAMCVSHVALCLRHFGRCRRLPVAGPSHWPHSRAPGRAAQREPKHPGRCRRHRFGERQRLCLASVTVEVVEVQGVRVEVELRRTTQAATQSQLGTLVGFIVRAASRVWMGAAGRAGAPARSSPPRALSVQLAARPPPWFAGSSRPSPPTPRRTRRPPAHGGGELRRAEPTGPRGGLLRTASSGRRPPRPANDTTVQQHAKRSKATTSCCLRWP